MSENPFCAKVSTDKNEYQEKMRQILHIEALYLLDGHDKDGESLESEASEEEDDALDSQEDEEGDEGEDVSEEDEEAGSDEDEEGSEDAGETEDTGKAEEPKTKRIHREEEES